jgi:hypothetical protein
MKLYAQCGHAPADKINRGIELGLVDGAILSPRYLTPDKASELIGELKQIKDGIDIFLDPEFYATRYVGAPNAQLRYLEEWPYFIDTKRNSLLINSHLVDQVLQNSFKAQKDIGCTQLIAPNIYIGNSFDSLDAAIAISFINRAKSVAKQMEANLPVYATIAAYRDAIIHPSNFISFLSTLTALEFPPDGIYSLVGGGPAYERAGTVRSEVISADVIAGWMLLNHSLSLNGIRVINGFSDILTPFLGAAGGYAGASGWWSNLQVFSMGRYIKGPGGGQSPLLKYLCLKLLNRIPVNSLRAYTELVPELMNNLPTDAYYDGKEPSRTEEALQSWEAIKFMTDITISNNIGESLERLENWIVNAESYYGRLNELGFSDDFDSNMEYLQCLKDSLMAFARLAEL